MGDHQTAPPVDGSAGGDRLITDLQFDTKIRRSQDSSKMHYKCPAFIKHHGRQRSTGRNAASSYTQPPRCSNQTAISTSAAATAITKRAIAARRKGWAQRLTGR